MITYFFNISKVILDNVTYLKKEIRVIILLINKFSFTISIHFSILNGLAIEIQAFNLQSSSAAIFIK